MSWQALDTSNSQNYESDDTYQTDSDSEYEDIEIAGWGDNAKQEVTWDTLIDPSVKVKAGGIGSGDLHRKGGNFKPLSEAAILAQRLNKGAPSKKSTKPKKPKKKPSAVAAPPKFGKVNRPYVPTVRPSVPTRAPIKNPSASTWGSAPLSDTPFWEKKQYPPKHTVPTIGHTTTPAPVAAFTRQQSSTIPQLAVFQFNPPNIPQTAKAPHEPVDSKSSALNSIQNNASWGSKAPIEIEYSLLNPPILTPKIKTLSSHKIPAFSVAPADEPPRKEAAITINTTTAKWNIEAQGFTPLTAKTETPKWNVDAQGFTPIAKTAETPKWDTSAPSFVPLTASTSTLSSPQSSISSPTSYNTDAPVFVPTFVPPSPVKKILKITSPDATHADTTTTSTTNTTTTATSTTSHAKNRVHLDKSILRRHLDIKPSTAQKTQSEQSHTTTTTATTTTEHQLESQTQPESTRGFEREPFLRIHLKISEGISTSILVEEGSDPESLAEEFGVTHKLKMTPKAKKSMAAFIARLIDEKKDKAKHGLLD